MFVTNLFCNAGEVVIYEYWKYRLSIPPTYRKRALEITTKS